MFLFIQKSVFSESKILFHKECIHFIFKQITKLQPKLVWWCSLRDQHWSSIDVTWPQTPKPFTVWRSEQFDWDGIIIWTESIPIRPPIHLAYCILRCMIELDYQMLLQNDEERVCLNVLLVIENNVADLKVIGNIMFKQPKYGYNL